jgi:DNA-binding transcriptional MocR family regulator
VVSASGPDAHGYMPNTGYPEVCGSVAGYLTQEQGVRVESTDVLDLRRAGR